MRKSLLSIPILALAAPGGFLFGWARPVPVNPLQLTRRFSMKTGMMLVAAAGPASNLILAILSVALFRVLILFDPTLLVQRTALEVLVGVTGLNLALCLFNLMPVYPLDGSRVLRGLLPEGYTKWLDIMERNPMLLLVACAASSCITATSCTSARWWTAPGAGSASGT